MASLQFDKVGKRFVDGTLALANVDLAIDDGEFMVLVGPSGCGKSTMLRCAAGLEDLTSGRILIGGRDVSRSPPGDRDVAMIFQNYALYPHMDVHDNMAFGLTQRRVPRRLIEQKITQAARTLDLTPYLRRKPGALSGGQRQRVAMGRAIVRDPQCFLMDEPLSNLDAKLRLQMRAELKLLNARLGVTTLYVTHDQVEAMTLGDRVAVLRPISTDGQANLQQCAAPRDVYANPANLFVASFIGSPPMTFLPARLAAVGSGLRLQHMGAGFDVSVPPSVLSARPGLAAWAGRDVITGVRPEDFFLAPFRLPGAMGGEVLLTEVTGADGYVFVDLPVPAVAPSQTGGEDSEVAHKGVTRVTVRIEPAHLPTRGDLVGLGVKVERMHFFDPLSGKAIC
jgi:multiple sugar transport system ATP-binding protein